MAEACATKIMEDDVVYPSPSMPDAGCLYKHCLCSYQLLGVSSTHPSPIRHGWELVDGR